MKTARNPLLDDAVSTTVCAPHPKLCPYKIGVFFLPHCVFIFRVSFTPRRIYQSARSGIAGDLKLSNSFITADRGSALVKVLCYKSEGSCFDPSWCQWIFFDIKSSRSHYGPEVDPTSNRNENHDCFLGVKPSGCVSLTTYHHPVPLSRNLGNLTSWKSLGLSRPVMGLLYPYFYILPLLLYITVSTITIEYNANATCFDLQVFFRLSYEPLTVLS